MKTINFEYRKVCLNVLPVPMNQHRGYKTQPKKNFKDYLKGSFLKASSNKRQAASVKQQA